MPTAIIDNKEIIFEKGTTILQAALENNIKIPHYCYHPALKIDGNCRMCLVEVEKMPKLTIACNTTLNDGMVIKTNSPKVIKARRGVLEFFLINHPLDCPVCDKAGECKLQDYSFTYGQGKSRFEEDKIVKPKKDIGEHILIYSHRCILCSRCVRFCADVSGSSELGLVNRGGVTEIDIFPGKRLDNKLAGNVVDICPVGALTSKDFLFTSRVWFLKKYETICTKCSVGCNVSVEVKDNKVYRVQARHNPYVNGYWICDIGRYNLNKPSEGARLMAPLKKEGEKQYPVDWDLITKYIKDEFLKCSGNDPESIGAILSGGATNEENYLLVKLMESVLGSRNIVVNRKFTVGDDERFPLGFVIEADKNPNQNGAALMLNGQGINYSDMMEGIKAGRIKCLYILNNRDTHNFSDEELEIFEKLDFLIVQDSTQSILTKMANVVLPSKIFFENEGTYTNSKGIVQRIRRILFPESGLKEGWQIIQMMSEIFGEGFGYKSAKEIFDDLSNNLSSFKGLSYANIGSKGAKVKLK